MIRYDGELVIRREKWNAEESYLSECSDELHARMMAEARASMEEMMAR